jgi:thiol-disulfide isomerase/thioredoxin
VSYVLPNYGLVSVARGKLGAEGTIALDNIAPSGTSPSGGQYWVEVASENLGQFRVKDEPGRQEFPLRMPPRAGDLADGDTAQDLESGQPVRIADFRGRVVFLEFWATWCGPCREPMQRLNELAKRRGASWRDDVALVAIGTDNDREVLRRHVRQNGHSAIRHLWSPQDQAEKPGSAYGAYSISGVPTAFLIGRDGRILWRGHPASIELERKIEELIARRR